MSGRRLGVGRALVDGRWIPGDVVVGDGSILEVGASPAGSGSAVPGFVDLQVNGFAGHSFFSASDAEGHREAATSLARTGVTSYLITVPTIREDTYGSVLEVAARHISDGPAPGAARPLGVHLEGPFLTRPGAHPRQHLRAPDASWCEWVVDRFPVVMMTLAPEPLGALALVELLAERGVVASIGHTDATAAQAHAGFDAGATAVTHLWNAQTAPTAREPGVVGAALARGDVMVGVIADLVHVDADTLRVTCAVAGDRVIVVSDAAPFAGLVRPETTHHLGASWHPDGSVRLPDGTLAGSASTLDAAVRNLVTVGVDLALAVDAVTAAPARLLGRTDIGALRPGGRADVVVLDDDVQVTSVLIGGRPVR